MAVVITKPPSGGTLTGTITVEATFNGQRFNVATCTVDGKQLGSDSMQPISFSVDTTKVQDGARTLTVAVKCRTAAGKMRWQKASIPIKVANALPNQWTKVADEYETFTLTATAEVRYGTGTAWNSKVLGPGSYQCGNPLFGDPLPGASKVCEVRGTVVGPPPPPPPPPTGQWSGPITITQGGTYDLNAESKTSSPAVFINTGDQVVLRGRARNLAGGVVIAGTGFVLRDVVMDHLFIHGSQGRVFDAIGVRRLIVQNCTFDKTSGMKITESHGVSQILLTRNRHRNIQRAALSQFCQFGEVDGNIELSWNEIINDPDQSEPEDVLSIYKTSGMHVHDNYIQGQWAPGNSGDTSQNGITVEEGEGGSFPSNDNRIENNQVVACMGGIGVFKGNNNQVLNNRVIRAALYPDGTRVVAGYSGLDIQNNAGSNNHAHGNLVGYVSGTKHGFGRTDWGVLPAHCEPLNTHYPGTVTRQSELDEWTFWVAKKATNSITVGA